MINAEQNCSELQSQNQEYVLQLDALRNELFQIQQRLDGSGEACKLVRMPYGTDEPIEIVFEGSCADIKNYILQYEHNPSQSKRCSFIVITGNILSADKWAPINAPFAYEPAEKKIG